MYNTDLLKKIEELGKHILVYGLGSTSQALIGYVLLPLYTSYFTTQTYGAFAILTLMCSFANSIFYFGATSALSRSYYDYQYPQRAVVISTTFWITIFGAITQIFLSIIWGREISWYLFGSYEYYTAIIFSISGSSLRFVNDFFILLWRLEKASTKVIIFNLINLSSTIILTFLFFNKIEHELLVPFIAATIVQTSLIIYYLFSFRNTLVFSYSKVEISRQLRFGIPIVLSSFAYYALDWIDRLLINEFMTLTDVGIYSFGYKIGISIHALFIIPFAQIWVPLRMEYRDDKDALEFFKLAHTYYFIFGLIFTVLISFFAREILYIAASQNEYIVAYTVVAPVMLGHVIYGAINVIDYGIFLKGKTLYNTYVFWSLIPINYLLNYLFIPIYGYIAAAYTTLITYILLYILLFVVSNALYRVPSENLRITKLFMWSFVALILQNSLTDAFLYEQIIWIKIVLYCGYIVGLYYWVLEPRERLWLQNLKRLDLKFIR